MKVSRYGHVHQLTFYAPLLPINVQVIEHSLGLILIDTGIERVAPQIIAYLESLEKPLHAILLTHAHGDHVGGVDLIVEAFPHVELYVSRRDARLLEGDRSTDPDERERRIKGALPKLKTRPTRVLDPGERLFGFKVILASGHTPGSIAYFEESSRFLYAGDAFQTHGGVAIIGDVRPLFPLPGLATWDKRAAVENGERLIDLSPLMTFVGHGAPLTGTHRLYVALKRAKRKQARFYSGGRDK